MLGFSIAISDICVTFDGGSTRDCLQKIYRVGPDIAVGFAGSVEIGFAMLYRLAQLLKCEAGTDWDPTEVANWWPADARAMFAQFPQKQKELGCDLLMASVHPNLNSGDAPWARSYLHVFRSPEFEAELAPVQTPVSIGSGSEVAPFKFALKEIIDDKDNKGFGLLQAEVGMTGGMVTVLGHDLTRLIEEHEPSGISPHLHLCMVARGGVTIAPNDYRFFGSASSPTKTFTMPTVARSWKELQEMLRATGATADGCTASMAAR